MPEPGIGQKQTRNAENTRQAILNAAEAVFAEHGFDGARIEAIAAASSYNQGLIFRYFVDKLGLYAEVIRRIDRQANEFLGELLGSLLEDERLLSDARRFKAFLFTAVGVFFDFMVEHPHVMRILIWEHAEGWHTYTKLASLFKLEGFEQLEALFSRQQKAGLLRADSDPFLLFLLAEQICWTYPTSLPFYQMVLPNRDFSSPEAMRRTREQVISFIIAGMLGDPEHNGSS
jgi:TetR/AcrR family transcriptional regulator